MMTNQQSVFSQRSAISPIIQRPRSNTPSSSTPSSNSNNDTSNWFDRAVDWFQTGLPSWLVGAGRSLTETEPAKREREEREAAEAEAKRVAERDEQRAYNERLAQEERERLEKLRQEEIARVEAREDSAIQRLVRDAMAAGISPAHVLGSASPVAQASPQGVTTQSDSLFSSQDEQETMNWLRVLLPLAVMLARRGRY